MYVPCHFQHSEPPTAGYRPKFFAYPTQNTHRHEFSLPVITATAPFLEVLQEALTFTGRGKLQRLGLISEIQKVYSSGIVTLTIKPYDIAAWKGTAGLEPHFFHHLRCRRFGWVFGQCVVDVGDGFVDFAG